MSLGSLDVLGLLGKPTNAQDVTMVFQLVLGRRPGRVADIDFHVKAPVARVVAHIMGSAEFLDRVLPQIASRGGAALRPVPAELADWAQATFGPEVDAYAETWADLVVSCFRSEAFEEIFRLRPKLKSRIRAEMPDLHAGQLATSAPAPTVATAPATPADGWVPSTVLPPAPSAPPSPTPATVTAKLVPRLLFLREDAPLGDEPILAARRLLLSAEFEAAVLKPLILGKLPAGLPESGLLHPGPDTPGLAELAATLFQGRLNIAPLFGREPASRFLLRLLRHADSLLRPDPASWSGEGLPATAVERLAALVCEAQARLAEADPLLRVPMFFAPARELGVDALFRFVLGRPPSKHDKLWDQAQRGYPAVLLRLLLTPEFERAVLRPLRAGRPVRHAAEAELGADHVAVLGGLLGRDAPPVNWPRDLALSLGDVALLEALGATEAEAGQADLKAHVLAALRHLGEEARQPPQVIVTVELRDDRRLAFLCRGLPPGQRLVAELYLTGPHHLTERVEASRNADGQFEALFTPPVSSFDPHAWQGHATFSLRDDVARRDLGPPAAPMPIRLAIDAPALNKLRARLVDDMKRATTLADTGRRRDALSLLDRMAGEAPGFYEARILAASITAAAGDLDRAAALLHGLPEGRSLPAAAELRGRLALRSGRSAEAAEAFTASGPAEGLRGRALALLAAACARPTPPMTATSNEERLREVALGLLRDPAQPAIPLAITIGISTGLADRAGLGRNMAAALALVFAPAVSLGEFLRELDAQDILPLDAILRDAEFRSLGHLLLPALAHLPPARIRDAKLLLAIGRTLDADGRTEDGLRFVEQSVHLGPDDFDARSVAATLCQRLRNTDDAVLHLQHAVALKPEDVRTTERLLSYEIEALRLDPLRPPQRQELLQNRMLELMQKALLKTSKAPTARLDYARFALMCERYEEAATILHGLAEENPAWTQPRSMLMRIAQLRNDHAGVLEWFARLHAEEVDERAVVIAAKAKRALGAVSEAQDMLGAHLEGAGPTLRREYVRNLFFNACFEEAAAEAARMLKRDDSDLELHFLAAAANLELHRNELAFFHACWIQMHGGSQLYPLEMPLFLYAVLQRNGDQDGALQQLDTMFARVGAQPVRLSPRLGSAAFDRLSPTGLYPKDAPHAPVFQGPKVSVVMTTYNVKDYVRTAVRSILQQSYRNLELIIVDDASTDSTPTILAELERSDPRIKLILKSTNDGTYVSKNLGLMQAQGEFAAFQDSDDWSHPDRLACSVGVLLRNPGMVGLTTDWLRMTTQGDMVIKAGGQIAHLCCISLMFRRLPVISRVGFFDSVRIAADLELIQRLGLTFGAKNVPRLRWPLLFGRTRSDSLTASEEFGISRTGFTEPREMYHRYADSFHERIAEGGSAYMPFPLRHRLFGAPAIILPRKDPA